MPPLQSLGQSSGSTAQINQSPSTTTTQTSLTSSVQMSKEVLTPSAPSSTRSPASTAKPDQSAAKTEATSKPSSTTSNHQPARHGTARIRPSASSKASHQSATTATPNHPSNHTVQTSQFDAAPVSQSATKTAQDLSGNGLPIASQSPTSAFQRNQADSTRQGSQSSTSTASPSQSAGSTVPTQGTPPGHSANKTTLQSQLGRTSLGQSQAKETLQSQSPMSATTAESSWTSTGVAANSPTPAIIQHDHLKSDESSSPSQTRAGQSAPLPTTTESTRSATTSLFSSSTPVSNIQVSSVLPGSKDQLPVTDSALNKQMKDEALRLLLRRRTSGRLT